MNDKYIEFEFLGDKVQCKLLVEEYRNNGNLAILLMCKDEDGDYESNGERYDIWCDLTKNLAYSELDKPYAFVQQKASTDLEGIIKKYKLAENTYDTQSSGFNIYSLYKFDMDKVNEYAIEVKE